MGWLIFVVEFPAVKTAPCLSVPYLLPRSVLEVAVFPARSVFERSVYDYRK
jgi:hypothetical protein